MSISINQKKRIRRASLGFLVLAGLAIAWDHIPQLTQLEDQSLDFRYRNFNRAKPAPKNITVIDIDEQSIKLLSPAYGRWPWPRRIYKDILEFLAFTETPGLFFDLMFTEAQKNTCPGAQTEDDDALLAGASLSSGTASHALMFLSAAANELAPGQERQPFPEAWKTQYGIPNLDGLKNFPQPVNYKDFLTPAPEKYMGTIPFLHFVNSFKDADGIHRRAPVLIRYGDFWMPSLSLAAVFHKIMKPVDGKSLAESGRYPKDLRYEDSHLKFSGLDGKAYAIPLDAAGRMRVHYYNLETDIAREPLAPLMDSAQKLQSGEVEDPSTLKLNPLALAGHVFMIGGSAAGLEDLKATPLDKAYPGVMIHATLAANILESDFLVRAPLWQRAAIIGLLLLSVYGSILLISNLILKILLPGIFGVGSLILAIWAFQNANMHFDLALPAALLVLASLDSLVYLTFVEGKEKKKIQDTLGKYLPEAVVKEMIATGSDIRAEIGKKQELSILFSDIRGFTSLSEKLPPEKVVAVLNSYLGRMTDVVFTGGGTLDKFIGDAIMAFWGAPLSDPNHATHAVQTALRMIDGLEALKQEWKSNPDSDPGIDLQIGIGINTGFVIVGNIGSEKKLDYTVIGDNVNLASRLEGLTKSYKSKLIIGERTHELLGGSILCRTADKVRVVGKTQAVKIFEPLADANSTKAQDWSEPLKVYEQAWAQYEKGDFKSALEGFDKCLKLRNGSDGLSSIYIERCRNYLEFPPDGPWEGIFVAKSK